MRVAVYGASGFTGGLVVEELIGHGVGVVAVGRGGPVVAALDDPAALVSAFTGCDAVISAVSPFAEHGEPVLRAAIEAGCHYVDTTGEQVFVRRVFDQYDDAATRAGVTVVPAATDDGVPGDLIASLVAADLDVDVLTVADLRKPFGASRGTARMAFAAGRLLTEDALVYDEGSWRTGLDLEGSDLVRFALPGVVTVPRHVRARRVQGGVEPDVAELFTSVTADALADMEFGPSLPQREASEWRMAAHAVGRDGRRAHGEVRGTDPYGTTARIAVRLVRDLVTAGAASGVRAPAEVVDPAGFLDRLGLRWEVAPPR